jgi:hypothetical protein
MFEDLDPDLLEEYFLERFSDELLDEEAYHLLLLVLGEKPGVLLMSVEADTEVVRDFCSDFDLEMKTVGEEKRSFWDKLFRRKTLKSTSIFVAEDEERFDLLERSDVAEDWFSDKSIGKFLGYPEDAVKYYENEDIPGKAFRDEADLNEFGDNDLAYLNFVGYVPPPEEEEISKAIETGKNREELLLSMDRELDTNTGSEYLSEIKNGGKI